MEGGEESRKLCWMAGCFTFKNIYLKFLMMVLNSPLASCRLLTFYILFSKFDLLLLFVRVSFVYWIVTLCIPLTSFPTMVLNLIVWWLTKIDSCKSFCSSISTKFLMGSINNCQRKRIWIKPLLHFLLQWDILTEE